jgi:serine beta-lactamase-like protein LACTB, mitochondrial
MKMTVYASLSIIGISVLSLFSFKFFDPVLTHRSGWKPLPAERSLQSEPAAPEWTIKGKVAGDVLEAGRLSMNAPALSAALSIDGKLVWRGAAGLSDIEQKVKANFDTRFRLGSTSKAVTAVGVGVLIDRGTLKLDQTIIGFPHAVTLGQVMSHRAGIRDYGVCFCSPIWEHLNTRRFKDIDAQVAVVKNSCLLFPPGTDFAYTSLGYNLTGLAIERASGQSYPDFMEQAVYKPLQMTRTSLIETDSAGFYETEPGRYKRAFAVDNSIRWPSGGIVSTPTDMVALGNAMLDDRLLAASTRSLLVSVPSEARVKGGGIYAYGWRHSDWTLFDGKLKLDSYHHNGTAVGSTSVFVILPERGVVLSVMMNKSGENVADISAVADQILETFIDLPQVP